MINLHYILRVLVYAQSFIWIYLLNKDVEIRSRYIQLLFPFSLFITYVLIKESGFYFSQYYNHLLSFYVLLMFNAYFILKIKYNVYDSICLSFLIVFINSYYWEFMFHFNAIIFYGLSFNQVIQSFHLIPTYLLYKKLEIRNRPMFFKFIALGLIISNLNLLAHNFINSFYFYGIPFNQQLYNNCTRFICLNLLLWVMNKYVIVIKKDGGFYSFFSK